MELRNGDLVGIPPSGWLPKLVCKVLGAKTFHWAMIVGQDRYGWIASESIGKGTAVTRFAYLAAYAYRIKGIDEPTMFKLVSNHSLRGEAAYDMQVNFLSGIWFLLKHYLKIAIPVIKNHTYNCQEWVVYMAAMLGVKLIPDDQYPYCKNLENSDMLERITDE